MSFLNNVVYKCASFSYRNIVIWGDKAKTLFSILFE